MRVGLALVALAAAVAAAASPSMSIGASAPNAGLEVRGSIREIDITGAEPGSRLQVLRQGHKITSARVGSLGGAIARNLAPGPGYRVVTAGGTSLGSVTVLPDRSAPPSTRIYHQRLPRSGYGYLRVRDGTKLAIDVRLPGGPGPYPTLVEYGGYGYANPYPGPAGPQNGISQLANLLGFAVVDVNMRGTGCSGGAYDFFNAQQRLDGYDAIETVARQSWVLHHRVGMFGISYGGDSQMFVAATDPPHLAAITPLSVLDNYRTNWYPGGIPETGHALPWAGARVHDAEPASSTGGQPWALQRIQAGDSTCAANQDLHPEAVNLVSEIHRNRYYHPNAANPLSPARLVHRIKAPVFMACQFTDEQAGGHCADLAQDFTEAKRKWFTFANGTHFDSLDPSTLNRLYDFLELYVAGRKPKVSPSARAAMPSFYQLVTGIPNVTLPPDSIQREPSYKAARAAFDRLPRIRVLFDNGAGSSTAGAPYPAFSRTFPRFPVPGTQAWSLYLGAHGGLDGKPPRRLQANRFTWDPSARPANDFAGGPRAIWGATPDYDWAQNPRGAALSYVSAPLKKDAVVIGGGALETWVRASTPDVDLQVTVSEVRPDSKETFVQNGWLDTAERKLDGRASTPLAPVLSERKSDAAPLPKGQWTKVTVPIFYEGHAYRAGSRIRVTISAPGGDQPSWSFGQVTPSGAAKVSLAASPKMPSRLLLPLVPGVKVPSGLPPCPGLRGEPCRPYIPLHDREAASTHRGAGPWGWRER